MAQGDDDAEVAAVMAAGALAAPGTCSNAGERAIRARSPPRETRGRPSSRRTNDRYAHNFAYKALNNKDTWIFHAQNVRDRTGERSVRRASLL